MAKLPLSALPLPAPSRLLIHNLTPDTFTPNPTAFRASVLTTTPSLQRRARLLPAPCHFSHVTPFPVEFPYDIQPPSPSANDSSEGAGPSASDSATSSSDPAKEVDKAAYIERWLSKREPLNIQAPLPRFPNSMLRKYHGLHRDQPAELIGLSETALRDCLPNLDVGDGFSVLGAPSLSDEFGEEGEGRAFDNLPETVEAREDLLDVLSGHATLMTPPDVPKESAFAPWSLRYSGHQFGSFAGQLGDGRAISILVTPNPTPENPDQTTELQLKGSGRTPFSRSADGLAVLRSSIREYLCSEAMHALGIPTTRALSIVSLPSVSVAREKVETASIVTRMAPSFIRIGNFEAFNGPTNMFFFGGGQQKPDLEGLRILGEWVVRDVLRLNLDSKEESAPWGAELVFEVARRNARMVAGWQAYGFMHGVINTDNVSILGLTIDYGPYAFMDVFDTMHICNHTDEGGRYAYKFQPNMIIYALRALLNALAPLIGAEMESGKAVVPGWANSDTATPEKLKEWTELGLGIKDEMERIAQQTTADEYGRLMRKRLGLKKTELSDESRLFKPLLDMMESHRLDFHSTFRLLSSFNPAWALSPGGASEKTADLDAFSGRIMSLTPEPASESQMQAFRAEWVAWLTVYGRRIVDDHDTLDLAVSDEAQKDRESSMRGANPRFVLRQWVLEDVIKRVERDADSGRRVLAKVLHMACNPFEPWGLEGAAESEEEEMTEEEKAERRYCGIGDRKMLGFQCSCSS